MFSRSRGGIEISLTERRPSAALSIFWKRNFKTERFQDFHCGYTDVWFVITHKRVVPQNHFASAVAAVCDRRIIRPTLIERRYRTFLKPAIESFARVMRQGTF